MATTALRDDEAVRLRLDLAYDGTDFSGWAAQPGRRTVQETVESALRTVLRSAELRLTCAGRTDAGVHARGQVVHVDVARQLADGWAALPRRLNGVLPVDVRVTGCREVSDAFDARFSALWRRYAYRISDGRPVDPLARRHVLGWPRRLDAPSMHAAAQLLLGEHDFAAFCRRREGTSTVRTLLEATVDRDRDDTGMLTLRFRADAFCHSMVRALAGSLVAVGEGRPLDWPAQVLAARVRHPAVTVLPARGLTLEEVCYPADDELATQAARARTVRTLG